MATDPRQDADRRDPTTRGAATTDPDPTDASHASTVGRRSFLGMAAGSAAAMAMAACTPGEGARETTTNASAAGEGGADAAGQASSDLPEVTWTMPTSWPASLEVLSGGAQRLADTVAALTGGRFTIDMRTAGEEVPPLEILQNVQSGAVECGHTASYYYTNFSQVMGFGTCLPFGLTARQQNSWLNEGGGLELLQAFYADQFNAIQFPAGNTGVQMGGWFNTEITAVGDLQGLRMRVPGLGGEVLSRLGVTVQNLPAGDIFQALQTGSIDAAEFVGPSDDINLEFQSVADYYYYPGWWEPGATLEMQINLDAWNELPEQYQEVLRVATTAANSAMLADYDNRNSEAIATLLEGDQVEVLPFPDDVMAAAEEESFALFDEFASDDATFAEIYESWQPFRDRVKQWHDLAELSVLSFGRDGAGDEEG